ALALADLIGLVRLEAVEGEFVFLGIDRDGGNAQFRGGPENPDRDLGAVGHQQAAEGHGHRSAWKMDAALCCKRVSNATALICPGFPKKNMGIQPSSRARIFSRSDSVS